MAAYNDAQFRAMYPGFEDTTLYPEAVLETYWDVALSFTDGADSPCLLLNGAALAFAINSLAAHILTVSQPANDDAAAGTLGASQAGYQTSSTISKISVGMMAPPAANGWEFWLSQTSYGQALWALLEIKAVGGFSVGGLPEREGFRKIGGVFF